MHRNTNADAWIERDGTPEEVADALLAELEIEFAKIEIPRRNGQQTIDGRRLEANSMVYRPLQVFAVIQKIENT